MSDDEPTTVYRGPVPHDPEPTAWSVPPGYADTPALAMVWGAGATVSPPVPQPVGAAPPHLFREQAVDAYQRGASHGSPLRIVPTWMLWSFRVIVLAVVSALAFASVAELTEHAEGPAVVRLDSRRIIGARTTGNVTEIPIRPGEHVAAGTVLVRLDDSRQRAELAQIEREHELALARMLRHPEDDALRKQLGALDAERQLAQARLEERTIIAPQDGIASDVRVRVGQHVSPGDGLVALDGDGSTVKVVAMLPGHHRPRLGRDGAELLLTLEGFEQEPIEVGLHTIADEVIGPAEALRFLGETPESVAVRGPVVVVEATISRRSFRSDGDTLRLYDGMRGRLDAELDRTRLIEMIIPGLRDVFE